MKLLNPFEIDFSGVHLIEASAGTGKTYNISSLYIRALIETGQTVDQILVVTYTEAATKELRDRLMTRLRESIRVLEGKSAGNDSFLSALERNVTNKSRAMSRLKKAIHSFDEAAVYTIHGFCRHALQEHAFNSRVPFEAELIGDDIEIIGEIVDDYWRKWVQEASKNSLKRPLLKLLLDRGYHPDRLTRELSGFAGKPYLEVKPEEAPKGQEDEVLYELWEKFNDLQHKWRQHHKEILQLLDAGHLSYYRTDWLRGWMTAMHDWLQSDVPPIEYFDKFTRFSQSYINQSLKKASAKKGIKPPQHPFFKDVDLYIERAEILQSFEVTFKRRLFDHIIDNLGPKKEELRVFSFDDLLIQLRNALADNGRGKTLRHELRKAYPIALVDEFQDTDPIQYEIFKAVYAGHDETTLFMIGDPKQSIYSFRGADIFAYLRAKDDASRENMFSLNRNYRSVPPLIDGVNALFARLDNPFILDNISFEPVRPGREVPERLTVKSREVNPIEIRQLNFKGDEGIINKGEAKDRGAEDTAAEIHKLLAQASGGDAKIGEQTVAAGDIAVLVRSHHQATLISDALRSHGIKSVKHSRESVFHSDETRDLYIVLRAVVEPGSERLISAALSSKILDYRANQVLALKEDESAWAEKLELFSEWHEMWQERGFAHMFRKLMQKENIAETVMKFPEGDRVLTNLIHLSELITEEEKERNAGMHTLLKWLLKKRNEDNKEVEEEQLRLESDENLVSVVTMHQSKGLEYPIVFCPYLWDSPQYSDDGSPIVYHDRDDQSTVYLDMNGKNDPQRVEKRFLKAKEELAESVRLAYVAITRSKYKCVINWINAKNNEHSALGFLLLGGRESFNSLRGAVDSDYNYDNAALDSYQSSFAELEAHPAIECPVIKEIKKVAGDISAQNEKPVLESESFERTLPLPTGYSMASFSSLIRNEQDDFEADIRAYYDEPFDGSEEEEKKPAGLTMFNFPKGPDPGTAIHYIFENIDFGDSADWNTVIEGQLQTQNIDRGWLPVVKQMLEVTLHKPLLSDQPSLRLSEISTKNSIAELEFYFTTGEIQLSEILAIIRPDASDSNSIDGLAEEGFLKGFIDLTFQHNDQFYILDYKTNYLGDSIEDYRENELEQEMKEALYDVQCHIYVIALHRFLQKRMKNYRYEKHFGGLFYLFLRGINEEGQEGVFYDRPDCEIINRLNECIKRKS